MNQRSPGENVLQPKRPDPPQESAPTALGAGVPEGIITWFRVHVPAPVEVENLSELELL